MSNMIQQEIVKAHRTASYMRSVSDVKAAEVIADHYMACINLAFDLRTLTAIYYECEMPEATKDAILHMRKEIERHHLEAFGTTIMTAKPETK